MNILIIGYGKMGKMVEEIALSKSDTIVGIIDKEEDWESFDKNNSFKPASSQDQVCKQELKKRGFCLSFKHRR